MKGLEHPPLLIAEVDSVSSIFTSRGRGILPHDEPMVAVLLGWFSSIFLVSFFFIFVGNVHTDAVATLALCYG